MRAESWSLDHQTILVGGNALLQRLDGGAVRPRKALCGGFAPGQPGVAQVFPRVEGHRHGRGNFEREHVLGVVGRCRVDSGVAISEIFRTRWTCSQSVRVPHARASMPVSSSSSRDGGREQRLSRFLAAGHRLPMVRKVGALDEQHGAIRGVNEDEHRNGLLVRHLPQPVRQAGRQATNVQNPTCRSFQNSAASASRSSSVAQSLG